jgi:hypothetical protein
VRSNQGNSRLLIGRQSRTGVRAACLGHLGKRYVAGRCAGADEVQHLAGVTQMYSGRLAGINAEALLAVTTVVLSMVAQSASVDAIRTCLV